MVRSLITLDPEDLAWIRKRSAETGHSMAQIVRTAIRTVREREEKAFDKLLDRTSGTWKKGNGLAYQRRLRKEWK